MMSTGVFSVAKFHSSKFVGGNVYQICNEYLLLSSSFTDICICAVKELVKKDSVGELLGQSHSSVGT